MSSIAEQKSDLREIIHSKVKQYLNEHPDEVFDAAMGAIRRLSATMTLKELEQWHRAIFAKEMIASQ